MYERREKSVKVYKSLQIFLRIITSFYCVFKQAHANPNEIPYIDELTSSIDYDSIENPKTSNLLEHNIALSNALPEIVPKLKKKYK